MLKSIKVLQLGSPTGFYGAERWILALIKQLDSVKIESWVASVRDDPHLKVPLCIEAEKLGFSTKIFDVFGKFNIYAVHKLRKFIITNGINILHTHHYKTDIIGYLATRGTSCKIVSTPHGWTKQPDFKLWIYEIVDRFFFPLFDAIAPLSDSLYKSLSIIPGMKNKLHLIKNGVDIDEIKGVDYIHSEISSLKLAGKYVIGYIGRIVPGKGLDILLDAVSKYGERNWVIVILGDGETQADLKSMAHRLNIVDQVRFLGFRPDRLAYLKGFDAFVLPSRSEGIPRCLMEAMVAGIPIVASDIPGCRNLIDGKTTGLLFQLDEPKQLADSLKRLNSDHILRERLCINANKFVQSQFSSTRMAKEYEELFFKLNKKQI